MRDHKFLVSMHENCSLKYAETKSSYDEGWVDALDWAMQGGDTLFADVKELVDFIEEHDIFIPFFFTNDVDHARILKRIIKQVRAHLGGE